MNKLVIDEKVCIKYKMTPQEVLITLAVRMGGFEDCINNMVAREILVDDRAYKVTQHWSDVMDEVVSGSSGSVQKSDEELLILAQKMRELYPEGKMKDRFGNTGQYYYRCNNSEVQKALKRFFAQFGNYPDEEVLDATRRYVASFQGQYWQKGMRLIKYFILKNPVKQGEDGRGHVEQVSDLLTFIENKENGDEPVGEFQEDWQRYARN